MPNESRSVEEVIELSEYVSPEWFAVGDAFSCHPTCIPAKPYRIECTIELCAIVQVTPVAVVPPGTKSTSVLSANEFQTICAPPPQCQTVRPSDHSPSAS